MASTNTEPTPQMNTYEDGIPGFPMPLHMPPDTLPHVADLPPPVHIYTIPPPLRKLVTLDLAVIHSRTTSVDDLRNFIKCFHHTIPRVRMACKAELVNSFIYYIVPILRQPHVFDSERGIIYSFDVPFQIELQEAPDAGEVGNDNQNGEAGHEGAANAA